MHTVHVYICFRRTYSVILSVKYVYGWATAKTRTRLLSKKSFVRYSHNNYVTRLCRRERKNQYPEIDTKRRRIRNNLFFLLRTEILRRHFETTPHLPDTYTNTTRLWLSVRSSYDVEVGLAIVTTATSVIVRAPVGGTDTMSAATRLHNNNNSGRHTFRRVRHTCNPRRFRYVTDWLPLFLHRLFSTFFNSNRFSSLSPDFPRQTKCTRLELMLGTKDIRDGERIKPIFLFNLRSNPTNNTRLNVIKTTSYRN